MNFLPKPETRRNEKASIARKKVQNINIHHQDENDEENMNAFLKNMKRNLVAADFLSKPVTQHRFSIFMPSTFEVWN